MMSERCTIIHLSALFVFVLRGRLTLPVNAILNGTHGAVHDYSCSIIKTLLLHTVGLFAMAFLSFCTLYPSKL